MVTGGKYSSASQLVAMYDQSGKFTYLPSLSYKRAYHACSHFINANGDTVSPIHTKYCKNVINIVLQTLLVTGGYGSSGIYGAFLSSTEIHVLSSSAWSTVASLPSVRASFPAVNVNNAVYVFGKINSECYFYFLLILFFLRG